MLQISLQRTQRLIMQDPLMYQIQLILTQSIQELLHILRILKSFGLSMPQLQ